MIIFMACMLILSIGVSCWILNDTEASKYIPLDCESIGVLFTLLGGLAVGACILILLICQLTGANVQGEWFVRYTNLKQKIQCIDQYDRAAVIEEIDEWNADYIAQQCYKQSPWTNWFCTLDLSEFSTLSLNENGGNDQ